MAGILPEGVMKLEGKDMGSVECIDNAYLVIEDGIITEYGGMNGLCGNGFQKRATPLAAGGGAHDEGVGGVVLATTTAEAAEHIALPFPAQALMISKLYAVASTTLNSLFASSRFLHAALSA